MFNRKGQGLSMNVIIIAAIALLVLVILSVLVLRTGADVSETNSCESVPGSYCTSEDSCDDGYVGNTFKSCSDESEPNCCIPLS